MQDGLPMIDMPHSSRVAQGSKASITDPQVVKYFEVRVTLFSVCPTYEIVVVRT
jgi:hypothetical protein